MLIISVKDDENNRWKRITRKKTKTEGNRGVTQVMVKRWELNNFVVRLN